MLHYDLAGRARWWEALGPGAIRVSYFGRSPTAAAEASADVRCILLSGKITSCSSSWQDPKPEWPAALDRGLVMEGTWHVTRADKNFGTVERRP